MKCPGELLLTDKELEAIADRIEAAVGIPANPIRYVTMKEVASAQLAKVSLWLAKQEVKLAIIEMKAKSNQVRR